MTAMKLLATDTVNGPAIITQHNSTTIVPPGYTATVLGHGDMRITRNLREDIDMTKELDPITLQVVGGALHSIAEQMGNVLYRMSYSSIIRESQDLGAGLFDVDFNTLCESDSTPMHIGSLPGYLRGIEPDRKAGGLEARRLRDPQPPLQGRLAFAGHRHRHAGVCRR